jgi:hypothetical protein
MLVILTVMGVRHIGVLIVFVVAVSGCGGGDSGRADRAAASATSVVDSTNPAGAASGQGQQPTSSPNSPTGAAASPSPSDPNIPATVKSPGPRVVVKGVVEERAEAGCLTLSGYELMADSALWHSVLAAGEPVQVTGYVDRGRISSCQQDKVLVVTDIRP